MGGVDVPAEPLVNPGLENANGFGAPPVASLPLLLPKAREENANGFGAFTPGEAPVNPVENANGFGASAPAPKVLPEDDRLENENDLEGANEKGVGVVEAAAVGGDEVDDVVGGADEVPIGSPKLNVVGFLGGSTAPFTDVDPNVNEPAPPSDGNTDDDDCTGGIAAEDELPDADVGLAAFGVDEKPVLSFALFLMSKGRPKPVLGEFAPPVVILVIVVADPELSLFMSLGMTTVSCSSTPPYAFRAAIRCSMYWLNI